MRFVVIHLLEACVLRPRVLHDMTCDMWAIERRKAGVVDKGAKHVKTANLRFLFYRAVAWDWECVHRQRGIIEMMLRCSTSFGPCKCALELD
jgi:hypothetical protein